MTKIKYIKAVKSSRNFNNRSQEETRKLYQTIQKAVALALKSDDEAIEFLVEVYNPYVKKIAGKYYAYVSSKMEYEDVLQETFVMFLTLLYRYNKDIASFSYYIKMLLPQHMYVWVEKVCLDKSIPIDIGTIETTIAHPELDNIDKVYNYNDSRIVEDEYTQFILKRSEKSSRSPTVKAVCLKVFLGSTTCSELSKELGITYHAVYEIVNKIKKELQYFFHDNAFSGFEMTSTGLEEMYIYAPD